MKKVPAFLLFVLVIFCAMGGVFMVRSSQEEQQNAQSASATEAPKEVSGSAVAQIPVKTNVPEADVEATEIPEAGQPSAASVTAAPTVTQSPTEEPTIAPTSEPTAVPTEEPHVDENAELAGVSEEEIAAVAEYLGIEEEDVELVLKKAEENGQTIDVEAIKSGNIDIQELWGIVTEALGEKKAYELLIKVMGSNLF